MFFWKFYYSITLWTVYIPEKYSIFTFWHIFPFSVVNCVKIFPPLFVCYFYSFKIFLEFCGILRAMASVEEINNKFLEMNITVSESALNKCEFVWNELFLRLLHDFYFVFIFVGLDLCNKYNLTAEELCDQWYAFTLTNLNGAAPTVNYLERLEKKEYQSSKAKNKIISTPKGKSSVSLIEDNSYPFIKMDIIYFHSFIYRYFL